ncbi:MAG: CmcJ/NvfI family oxidoreductase [Proteobacteria bacterium]|nr:CmcJ/NvfI family oxidoreductase [Pseudomonadota bacterium]
MNTKGIFNYISADSQSSLYRNGKVLTRRNLEGTDSEWVGVNYEQHEVVVNDARNGVSATLEKQGFQLVDDDIESLNINFFDNDVVLHNYYPLCADRVKESVGARVVYAFDHNVRSAVGKKSKKMITGGQQVQGPAHAVHGDYTLTSAPERVLQLSKPPGKNDTIRSLIGEGSSLIPPSEVEQISNGGRFAIINLWRSIVPEPVEMNPLALCDASRVNPDDLVVFEVHYEDRIGENYFAKYNPNHNWWFYPKMNRSEALLIKQWDSEGGLARTKGDQPDASFPEAPCTFSFHSAFKEPSTPDEAPDRWSMEVRCIALF